MFPIAPLLMTLHPDVGRLNDFHGTFQFASPDDPFELSNGQCIDHGILAYETYGELNENKDNAILVFHALSGSQHAAGYRESVSQLVNPLWADECKTGWWDGFIGNEKVIDTSRYFIICANYIGGCYGSTGPASRKPNSDEKYMSSFPWITMEDLVLSQMKLIDFLEIKELKAVVGASLGGLLALTTMLLFPARTRNLVSIASGLELQPLQVIHNFEQVRAIENDSLFLNGDYEDDKPPVAGLELARMIGHKTYVSLETMTDRAKQNLVQKDNPSGYTAIHQVESYFNHQAKKFSKRFDANSYLRILNAWQKHSVDDKIKNIGALHESFKALIISIDSDVCFYPDEQRELHHYLKTNGLNSKMHEVHSEKGHDSFLLEPKLYHAIISAFLADS